MPIVLGGNKTNISNQQILKIITEFIKDNWLEDNPPVNDADEFKNVSFNNDWYDNAHDYEVVVILNADIVGAAALGHVAFEHGMFIEIHVFTRELSEHYPATMSNINKEISRILYSNIQGFRNHGISLVLPNSFRRVDEEDNTSNTWHSMMTMQVIFTKFIIPSS